MSKHYSVREIVKDLLTKQPRLKRVKDTDFFSAFKLAAIQHGYSDENMPLTWSVERARYDAKRELSGKRKHRLTAKEDNLVKKARFSALQAVATYNNPLSPFRSGSYIVHMHIAWNSLLLALLFINGDKPYFKEKSGRYTIIDGSRKFWDLATCMKKYWKGQKQPISENLQFFIGLRNKIEHAIMPELDLSIFGECQAMLINFEDLLTSEFGTDYAMSESLAMSLQFSRMRDEKQADATRSLRASVGKDIQTYIDTFRGSLSTDIMNDMAFSYKVFLVPNVGNHRSKDALAVEFVHYDPDDPDQADAYAKGVMLIKQKHIPVANLELFKPSEVAPQVEEQINKPFKVHHHTRCWQYYRVRPTSGSSSPKDTNPNYCVYDSLHRDYGYTKKWVKYLIERMSDPAEYNEVMFRAKQD